MVTIEIHPFDAANYLTEAENLTKLAKATGTNRQALYTALSENGNPALETLLKVLAALGTRLKCEVGAARGDWQRSSRQRIASAEWQLVGGHDVRGRHVNSTLWTPSIAPTCYLLGALSEC